MEEFQPLTEVTKSTLKKGALFFGVGGIFMLSIAAFVQPYDFGNIFPFLLGLISIGFAVMAVWKLNGGKEHTTYGIELRKAQWENWQAQIDKRWDGAFKAVAKRIGSKEILFGVSCTFLLIYFVLIAYGISQGMDWFSDWRIHAGIVISILLLTQRWVWLLVAIVGGLASLYSILASIIHFQVLWAIGYTATFAICVFIYEFAVLVGYMD